MRPWRTVAARALALHVILVVAPAAWGGGACIKRAIRPEELARASELALKVRALLEPTGYETALVARIGSDVSHYGLKYTHVGLLFRNQPKGHWMFTHVLNHCGTDEAELYDEGLINFFADDPFRYEALVVVPSTELQKRLHTVVFSPAARSLHTPVYSTIAHPYSERYVNSSHWVMAVIAAAQALPERVTRKDDAFRQLAARGFTGAEVHIGGGEQLFASLFRPNIRFDDHSDSERSSGRFATITARSVVGYLQRTDRIEMRTEVSLPPHRQSNPYHGSG